jgi:hypothetical protein
MMDDRITDPALAALEARLGQCAPRLSASDQNALALECGFAAGRQAARREVRRWQCATGSLVVLALAMAIPLSSGWSGPTTHPQVANYVPRSAPRVELPRSRTTPVETRSVDAWQLQHDTEAVLAAELKFQRSLDPQLRSQTLTTASRSWQLP